MGSVLTARHVTTPLRRLAAAAERLGAGDYTTPLGGQRRNDEIGDLAQAFERMRVNVATQQEEILKLAYWDSLTGLPNRVQFRNAVIEAMAIGKADGRSVAVIMLDLDRFKHVNDVLGYRFGDLMLKGVAERLSQQAVRNGDLVARLGGDEFAVLLADLEPASDLAHTRSVAQRLHQAFGDVMTLEDQTVDMSASFGMAVWPHHAADADTLLSRAEVAMYTAKRRSEGPMLYDPSIDAASTQTLSLLSELRHAVDHHELRLYLQPKLALDNGRVVGAEALLRWQHPTARPGAADELHPVCRADRLHPRAHDVGVRGVGAHVARAQRGRPAPRRSRSTSRRATCSTSSCRRSSRRCWSSTSCRPRPSAWRSPRARSWTTRSAR